MCSKTLGPAMAPSLFTWPTMRMGMSRDLAQRIIRLVHSRTWVTLPGEEVRSVWFMVWMESIITRSGFSVRMCSATSWASVSVRMRRLGLCTPRRLARSLIWRALSSPET